MTNGNKTEQCLLPVDIVLAPEWWNTNTGLTFDEDFFFHPARRVEDERKMEQTLYERWGDFGLGEHHGENRPEVGAVHLASGFLVSEMLGCDVEYRERNPPSVHSAHLDSLSIDPDKAFTSKAFRRFQAAIDALKTKYGHVHGDINFGGVLNVAMDLRGEQLFMDMYDKTDEVEQFFQQIHQVIDRLVKYIQSETGTSSISVNRNVRNLPEPLFLHSECSLTMISTEDYERCLLPLDIAWSQSMRPFGIHYCGSDPHRYADSFAKIPKLDFLDVGWGGDVALLRKKLPNTFLNLRLNPVDMVTATPDEISAVARDLVQASDNSRLTGVCCINMDEKVSDDKITALFDTVRELRLEQNK
jgi:hypothetical protein